MSRRSVIVLAAVLTFASSACYEPGLPSCKISCGSDDSCPSGQSCRAGLCTAGMACTSDGPDAQVDGGTADHLDAEETARDVSDAPSDATEADASHSDAKDSGSSTDVVSSADADAAADRPMDGAAQEASAPDAPVDIATTVPRVCPPGVRVNTRTGLCQIAHDLNGDGLADGLAGFAARFDALISDGSRFHHVDKWVDGGPFYSTIPSVQGVLTGDVNGDRITDVVAFDSGHVTVLLLPGTGTGMYSDFFYIWAYAPRHGDLLTYLADVTGDGKDDVIAINDADVLVAVSSGYNFVNQSTWSTSSMSGYNGAYFADVDGDFCADGITIGAKGVDVRLSTKKAFAPSQTWLSVDLVDGDVIHFADVDGDGLADYVRVRTAQTSVALSNGHGFGALSTWFTGALAGSSKTFFSDVDGDGRSDIIGLNKTNVEVALSKGNAFAAPTVWYDDAFVGTTSTTFAFEPAGKHPQP